LGLAAMASWTAAELGGATDPANAGVVIPGRAASSVTRTATPAAREKVRDMRDRTPGEER
jgi:hypothetical protein